MFGRCSLGMRAAVGEVCKVRVEGIFWALVLPLIQRNIQD